MSRIRSSRYKTAKEKKAQRRFGKILAGTFKFGAIAVSGSKKKRVQSKIEREHRQVSFNPNGKEEVISDGGCLSIIVFFMIYVLLIMGMNEKTFYDRYVFSFFISIFFAVFSNLIIKMIKNKTEKEEKQQGVKKKNDDIIDEVEYQKVNDITALFLADNPFEDIKNVFGEGEIDTKILVESFNKVVEYYFEDNLISKEEENRIIEFKEYFNLSQKELNNKGNYEKVIQGIILRDIMEGYIPDDKFRLTEGEIPFVLGRNEKMIWLFQNVGYYEETIKRTYVGHSSGVGIKVAKGLYYRTGSFKGNYVDTDSLKYFGNVFLGFSNKHIFFYSMDKSFKIPYSKIVAIIPFEDGLRIQKEGVRAKPQTFSNISGWFSYNLIINLAKMK